MTVRGVPRPAAAAYTVLSTGLANRSAVPGLLDTSAPARYHEFEPEPHPRIPPLFCSVAEAARGPTAPKILHIQSATNTLQDHPQRVYVPDPWDRITHGSQCQWKPQVVCFVAGTAREFLGPARFKSGCARSTNLCSRPPLWFMRLGWLGA
jgi:hypothetical protein